MRYIKTILGAGALLCAASMPMYGVNISLFESAGNVNGTVTTPIDQASWDEDTGLGTILVQVTGAGAHNVAVFLDHEIDQAVNTYYNEFGSTSGSLARLGGLEGENHYFRRWDALKLLVLQGFARQMGL